MPTSSRSVRQVVTTRLALAAVIGLSVLSLLGACSSRNETYSRDVTGSVPPQPSTAGNAPTPRAEPLLNRPETVSAARPATFRSCDYTTGDPGVMRRDVTASIPRSTAGKKQVIAGTAPVGSAVYRPADDVTGSIPTPAATRHTRAAVRYGATTGMIVHVIAPHETLYSIARRHRTSVAEITRINRIDANSVIRYGDVLIVPRA